MQPNGEGLIVETSDCGIQEARGILRLTGLFCVLKSSNVEC